MEEEDTSASRNRSTISSRRWIVRLLAVCTVLALILYLTWEPEQRLSLQTAGEVDDMIRNTLDHFPVPARRVQIQTVAIDSLTSRRVYTISVPPEFSKTQWHYELDKVVRPYRIQTPARVLFPDRDLHIHLVYNDNIIRTVRLRTISDSD